MIVCHKIVNTVMPKLSYDNVTMLDNMTRQCDTVMSPDGLGKPPRTPRIKAFSPMSNQGKTYINIKKLKQNSAQQAGNEIL